MNPLPFSLIRWSHPAVNRARIRSSRWPRAPHRAGTRSIVLALTALVAAGLGNARAADSSSDAARRGELQLFPDEALAKGKGFEIRRSQLDDAVAAQRASAAAQGQTITESRPGELQSRIFDRLILTQILLQKATDDDKTKAKEDAAKVIKETKARLPSEASYKRQLLALGLKPEQFEGRLLEQATVERVLDRELRSKITMSPEQIKEFYDSGVDSQVRELQATVDKLAKSSPQSTFYADGKKKLAETKKANLERLQRSERVRGAHILVYIIDPVTRQPLPDPQRTAKREQMQKIIARLKAGEDFTKLAKEYSEDPEVQKTGGEYVVGADTSMAPELKAAWFSLATNQISDLITTQYGYHVARVTERTPAGKIPFAEAEKEIKDYLVNQELQRRLPEYYEAVKKEFNVQVLVPAESK